MKKTMFDAMYAAENYGRIAAAEELIDDESDRYIFRVPGPGPVLVLDRDTAHGLLEVFIDACKGELKDIGYGAEFEPDIDYSKSIGG